MKSFALIFILFLFISSFVDAQSVSVTPTSVTYGGSVIAAWSGFGGTSKVEVWRGSENWIPANTNAPGNGTQELTIYSDWQLRNDYRIKVYRVSNPSVYAFSNYFSVICIQPSPPSLSSPSSGYTTMAGNTTFSWGTSSGANRYRLKVCTDINMTSNISGSPFELTAGVRERTINLSAGTYYWQVGAISSYENCGWGNYGPTPARSLTVVNCTVPSPPSLSSPAAGITIIAGNTTFSWGTSSGANRYRLKVCTDINMTSNISGSPFELTAGVRERTINLSAGSYYWQVGAISSYENCGWGSYGPTPARSLTVVNCTVPSPPSLSSPAAGTTIIAGNTTFSWGTSSGANRYRLKVCTDINMTSNISGSPFELTAGVRERTINLPAGTYYWQVGAISSNENCGWGSYGPTPARELNILPTIQLLSPSQNQIVNSQEITFSWSNINAVRYELYVDNTAGLGSCEISKSHIQELQNYTGTSYMISGNWLPDNVYYWKVIAFFADGTSRETSVGSFTYTPPKLENPQWSPFYRLYKSADHDHFYCAADNHRQQAISSGFTDERVEGFISSLPFNDADMVCLYRLYNSTLKMHYYTSDGSDRDNKIISGFLYEGIIGFGYRSSKTNLVPIYKLYKDYSTPTGDKDYFYTVNWAEKTNAQNVYGFNYENIIAYCSPNGNNETQPVGVLQLLAGDGVNTLNGNYQYSTKASFNIQGKGIPLQFEHIYNTNGVWLFSSILPLGPGWSHTYNSYVVEVNPDESNSDLLVVFPDGNINHYSYINSAYKCQTRGVYNIFSTNTSHSEVTIKTKSQILFTYKKPTNAPEGFPALLDNITDRNGNTITCTYETNAPFRLIKVTGTDGRYITFQYYTEDFKKNLTSSVSDNSGGRNIQFIYDTENNLIEYRDPKNQSYYYSYDEDIKELHLLNKVKKPEGNEVNIAYGNAVTGISGRKVANQQIGNNLLNFTFNADRKTTVKDANSVEQRFEYSSTNQLTQVYSTALNKGEKFYYEDANNPTMPTKVEDRKGNISSFTYDLNGNVTQISQLNGSVIHKYQYDANNNITKYTNPLSKEINYGYDLNGNLTSISNSRGTTSFVRNSYGKIQSLTNALSHTTSLSYNNYGNLSIITDPLSHTTNYGYDNISRLISITNAKNQTNSFSYDANDLLTQETDASSAVTKYYFDRNDNLTSILNAKNKTTSFNYDYDNQEQILTKNNPGLQQLLNNYRNNGQINSRTDPNGNTTNYGYDASGRMNQITSNNLNASLTYDDNNNIINVSETGEGKGNGNLSFTYDGLDRLTNYTDFYGNTVQYTYDLNSNIKSIIYPGNKTVSYSYWDDNRLKNVTDWNNNTTTYNYRNDGSLIQITYPNAITCNYNYDNAERNIGITIAGSSTIADYQYTLDEIGNHLQESITQPLSPIPNLNSQSTSYTYDDANRILSAGSNLYGWDNNGNMVSKTENGTTTSYTYDTENRLTSINGTQYKYIYDAFGNRRAAIRNGVARRYVLDINNEMSQVLLETDENGTVINYYVYGLGLISRINPSGTTRYYHGDFRGSVIAMTNNNGSITHKYSYDPFGKLINQIEEDANQFKYVGIYGVIDEGNGLQFMRARYYDPFVGRFLSEDPIWGKNLFTYSNNDPVNKFDPLGKYWEKITNLSVDLMPVGYNDSIQYCGPSGSKKISQLISQRANKSCFIHDLEYGIKGRPRILSDINFAINVYKETRNLGWVYYYFIGVRVGGYISYLSAQKDYMKILKGLKPMEVVFE